MFSKFAEPNIILFILPQLSTFDGIIGFDFLKQINGQINCNDGVLRHKNGEEKLLFHSCREVNKIMINLTDCDIPKPIFQELTILLEKHKGAFADSNEALSLHTDIVATVRTETDEPIYSKSYPYPLTLTEFLNNEIENLLDNGIIRPFRSTYNNPIWIVDKKGLDETGIQKKRL